VLGEGARDTAFLEHLCLIRNIVGLAYAWVGGNKGFGSYLQGMYAQPRFGECKSILLMSDIDESADVSFALIKEQLKDAGFPCPSRPLEIAHKQGYPFLGILMLPYPAPTQDTRGCLETLLIPAMDSANPMQAACVDQMLNCVGVASWPKKSSQDKVKVRCLISAVWSDDPMYGLQLCFPPEKNLIPLDHAAFNEVALILQHFQSWSSSNIKDWTDWKKSAGV
jgi:hypothetical protein